jgi:hypothetical protein
MPTRRTQKPSAVVAVVTGGEIKANPFIGVSPLGSIIAAAGDSERAMLPLNMRPPTHGRVSATELKNANR